MVNAMRKTFVDTLSMLQNCKCVVVVHDYTNVEADDQLLMRMAGVFTYMELNGNPILHNVGGRQQWRWPSTFPWSTDGVVVVRAHDGEVVVARAADDGLRRDVGAVRAWPVVDLMINPHIVNVDGMWLEACTDVQLFAELQQRGVNVKIHEG